MSTSARGIPGGRMGIPAILPTIIQKGLQGLGNKTGSAGSAVNPLQALWPHAWTAVTLSGGSAKLTFALPDVMPRMVYMHAGLFLNEYIGIAVSFVLAGGISALMIVLSSRLGKKHPTSVKLAPFECGKEPLALPAGRFAIKFYLVGILFILFDVELVFLYPWAVVYQALGVSGLVEIGVFLGILMVGFIYAWDNGALNWR